MDGRDLRAGPMGAAWRVRAARGAAAAVLCLAALAGQAATPDEDFQRGDQAYRAGDVVGAMAPLRQAADDGHPAAQVLLAEILDRAEFDAEAVAYYRRAAAQGYAAGEFGLGTMYLAGEGVALDRREALAWFERAAARGHAPAVIALAQTLMDPPPGEENAAEVKSTLRWVREAARLDYLPAVERLALAYRSGGLGLHADAQQAQAWAEKARDLKTKQAGTTPRRKR